MTSNGGTHRRAGHRIRNTVVVGAVMAALIYGVVATLGASTPGSAATRHHASQSPVVSASPTQTARPALTAEQITRRLHLRHVTAYTVKTDPNHLIGTQHGYTSKAAWGPQKWSSVEVFSSTADAQMRYAYVGSFGCPFGDGHDYVSGTALLRVACDVGPVHARKLHARFIKIMSG